MVWKLGKRLRTIRRLNKIFGVLVKHGFGDVVSRLRLDGAMAAVKAFVTRRKQSPTARMSVATRIRATLEELGPTFVKLGQMLATRPDILPVDVVEELRRLHDAVKPFPYEQVVTALEGELGCPADEVFASIDEEPIAAASIAQVHRATLMDGRLVALKVQRPHIRSVIEADLDLLYLLADILTERVAEVRRFDPRGLVRQLDEALHEELEFDNELGNMLRFARNHAEDSHIYVPAPVEELSTARLLVMEFIDGVRITDVEAIEAMGLATDEIIHTGMTVILDSIFKYGFFHADPHPGNFFVMKGGTLAVLDFGIMGTVSQRRIDEILYLLAAVMINDMDLLTHILLEMNVVGPSTDLRGFKDEVGSMLDRIYSLPLDQIRLEELLSRVMHLFSEHDVKLPSDLLLVLRSMAILEGVTRQILPSFSPIDELRPYIMQTYQRRLLDPEEQSKMMYRVGQDLMFLARTLPASLRRIIDKLEHDELTVKIDDEAAKEATVHADRRANRGMIFALATLVLVLSLAAPYLDPALAESSWPFVGELTSGFLYLLLLAAIRRSGGL